MKLRGSEIDTGIPEDHQMIKYTSLFLGEMSKRFRTSLQKSSLIMISSCPKGRHSNMMRNDIYSMQMIDCESLVKYFVGWCECPFFARP